MLKEKFVGSTKIKVVAIPLIILALLCLIVLSFYGLYPQQAEPLPELSIYSEALNRTLGFHKVYAVYNKNYRETGQNDKDLSNLMTIARFMDIDIQYIPKMTYREANKTRAEKGYRGNIRDTAELLTHLNIYNDMVENDIQSAVILDSAIDVEMDLKVRISEALGNRVWERYDILFIGRTDSEITEPKINDLKIQLNQTRNQIRDDNEGTANSDFAGRSSAEMQQHLSKSAFLHRRTSAFRTTMPTGIHAYAINRHVAQRLSRRLSGRMQTDTHDLDYILADMAIVGLSIAYSVSPPPIVKFDSERSDIFNQHLQRSALHLLSLRDDDPELYPPYRDLSELWGEE